MLIPAFLAVIVWCILMFYIEKNYTHLAEVYSKEMGEKYDGEGNISPDGETYYVDDKHKIDKYIWFRFANVYQYSQFSII